MREIVDYSLKEWARMDPLKYAFKECRNRIVQSVYNRTGLSRTNAAIEACKRKQNNLLLISVLFETPWIADWLCRAVKMNLENVSLVLFDNSRSDAARLQNKLICDGHGVQYVALPKLKLRNVNWSHSSALQWIFINFIYKIRPDRFAFIDHDLIPFDRVDLSACVDEQPFYGLLRPGGKNEKKHEAWSLWAGYSVFNYKKIGFRKLDFLYNFSMGLDTGGSNYEVLYREFDKSSLIFSSVHSQDLILPDGSEIKGIQVIDNKWFHVGSVSYAGGNRSKQEYWSALDSALTSGSRWTSLVSSSYRTW